MLTLYTLLNTLEFNQINRLAIYSQCTDGGRNEGLSRAHFLLQGPPNPALRTNEIGLFSVNVSPRINEDAVEINESSEMIWGGNSDHPSTWIRSQKIYHLYPVNYMYMHLKVPRRLLQRSLIYVFWISGWICASDGSCIGSWLQFV